MSFRTIQVATKEGVERIQFNRPDKMNALNDEMGRELLQAFSEAEKDESVRCIVLTGSGKAFCAGEDISSLKKRSEDDNPESLGDHLRRKYFPLILGMRRLPKPIIASINGVAAGSGSSLAFASDIRIASEEASFIQAFIRIGLAPDSGSSFYLPRLLGLAKAMEFALTGDVVTAREAYVLGLVNRLVTASELEDETKRWATRLAKGPTIAYGLTKQLLDKGLSMDLEEVLIAEAYGQEIAGRTKDHAEGVRAFFEKREPNFQGK